jgi:type IV pilus assembly protein PilC
MLTPAELNRRAELYIQLATTIAAGMPLIQALDLAGRNKSLRSSRKIIQALILHLKAGHTFGDSMLKVKGWLPEFDIALLSAGETSGRLDESFKLLGRYYASRAKIIRDTISDLATTALTLHVFLLVFPLGLLVKCASGFMDSNFSECLPFILEKVAVFGVLYAVVFALIFAGSSQRGASWRAAAESIFQIVPLLGTALKYLALARLASALDALTNAGVSVVRSWELAGAASGSPRLTREISGHTPQLETGLTLGEMTAQISYFPEMFTQLFSTAELSGKIDETLVRLHTYYEEEGFRILRMFTKILNRTIYFTLVLIVAYAIISYYTGYFNNALKAADF